MAMNLRSALQVSPEQIRLLDEYRLRDLMSALLHAEGYRCGAKQSEIWVSDQTKAGDEGCDGWSPRHRGRGEWMPKVPTCWQFKAGTAGQPERLQGEVKKSKPREALRAGGAFVVVASGASGKTAADKRLQVLRREAGRLPKDQIRVYTCENLAAWCNCYPAIAARFVGLGEGLGFLRVEAWESDPQFARPYYPSRELAGLIATVREELSLAARGASHVHVWGQPGVGKTRLALEIVRAAELRLFAVYLATYSVEVVSFLAQLCSEPQAHLIVVVDEAPAEAVPVLSQYIRLAEGRLRLLTIGPSQPADSYGIQSRQLQPLAPDVMRLVVREQAPQLPEEHVGFVVRFADGYVKLARIVCDALAEDPDVQGLELLQRGGDVRHLMDRLLVGLTPAARRSLHVVALLSRVGWEGDADREGQAVAACLGLNWLDVKHHVDLAHQQLAIAPQAGRLRYISPRPLALYLALEAMRSYRDQLRQLPGRLPSEAAREAFYRRLGELAEFPAALPWVREEIDRFFSLADLQSDHSARVWSHLALAVPAHAAAQVRAILEKATAEEKQAFGPGRREVVWALVKLAWRRESFEDAMLGLAELAVAENESFSNNATGEFCNRFQVVLGGTEVPYLERLAVLDQLLRRADPHYRRLAIEALSRAGSLDETRLCHGEDHGIRSVRPEWRPDDREAWEASREAIRRLTDLARQGGAELEEALVAATHHCLPLLTHGGLPDEVGELVRAVAARYPQQQETLRRDVAERLDLLGPADEGFAPRVVAALTTLHDSLVDPSTAGRLRQFAGRQRWDTSEPPSAMLRLVEEFLADPGLLDQHFLWLTSGEAENAWEFGRLLGEGDRDSILLARLTSRAGRGTDLRVACAYLTGQATHHPSGWLDDWLDRRLTVEPQDDELVLEATWRAGASERGARRLIQLFRRGHLPAERFACLIYSNWSAVLDVGTLRLLLEELVRRPKLRPTALALLRQRLHRHPEDLPPLVGPAARLVSDPALVLEDRSGAWVEVASALLPARAREVSRAILAAHASRERAFLRFSLAAKTLRQCAAQDPAGVWAELVPYLEDEEKASLFSIGFPAGIIDVLPHDLVLEWAAGSPDHRAATLARLATPDFTRDDSLAAKLADRYGDGEAASSALFAQLIWGASNGSLADHWAGMAAQMEQVSRTTHSPGLRRWARQAGESLRRMEARDRDAEAERELETSLR